MNPRTTLAIIAGKAAGAASRRLGRGGGTAIAGVVALRIDPALVRRLAPQAGRGVVAITGTNGKTTTSLMLSRIADDAGARPLHNRSGSNMMRGIAATLAAEASVAGALEDARERLLILEIDEATLPEMARETKPSVVVFTNLFRDQLDRYGEVDTVARAWERALGELQAAPPTIVLNADDPAVAHLGREYAGRVVYYGIDDPGAAGDATEHASDYRTCLVCGGELTYTVTFYGHLGHWRCPSCGSHRPHPDVRAVEIESRGGGDTVAMRIDAPSLSLEVVLPMAGLYNTYNALSAAAAAVALGLPGAAVESALEGFSAAFGRQERFAIDGRDVHVLLGKNPAGLNQVLRTLAAQAGRKRLVFILNDGLADGRDISWIWDTDYELLQPQTDWPLAAGVRAEDMALRMKYAGYGDDVPVVRDVPAALRLALDEAPAGGTLFVIPTYTAMLEAREWLAKRAGQAHFWEEGA
jgi:UDP-N-acetylmuramyl tripeptide synthase